MMPNKSISENDAIILALSADEIMRIARGVQKGILVKRVPDEFNSGKLYIYCKRSKKESCRLKSFDLSTGRYYTSFEPSDDELNGCVVGYVTVESVEDIMWNAQSKHWQIAQEQVNDACLAMLSRDSIDDYLNRQFPKAAMIKYINVLKFHPFVERCEPAKDIVQYYKKTDEYKTTKALPAPWLHFVSKYSNLPDTYKAPEKEQYQPVPEIPNPKILEYLKSRLQNIFRRKKK